MPVYTLRHTATVATGITVLQIKAGTNKPLQLLECHVTQTGLTTESRPRLGFVRKSGAATVTAAAVGTTLFKNASVDPTPDVILSTSGTGVIASGEGTDTDTPYSESFSVLAGFHWVATPKCRVILMQSEIIGLKFLTAPSSATWEMVLVFEEFPFDLG